MIFNYYMKSNISYLDKYRKYKNKYINTKKQFGGIYSSNFTKYASVSATLITSSDSSGNNVVCDVHDKKSDITNANKIFINDKTNNIFIGHKKPAGKAYICCKLVITDSSDLKNTIATFFENVLEYTETNNLGGGELSYQITFFCMKEFDKEIVNSKAKEFFVSSIRWE